MNIFRMIVLGSWVISSLFGPARFWQEEPPQPQTPNIIKRLVVFEGFLKPG